MQSKILFIIIFVALHVNYICSLTVITCQNDQDAYQKALSLKSGIVPVLLVNNANENTLINSNTERTVRNFYEPLGVENLLVVPANTCVATEICLNFMTPHDKKYPSLFILKDSKLVPGKWYDISSASMNSSLKKADEWNADCQKFTFEAHIKGTIRFLHDKAIDARNARDAEAIRAAEQSSQSPPVARLITMAPPQRNIKRPVDQLNTMAPLQRNIERPVKWPVNHRQRQRERQYEPATAHPQIPPMDTAHPPPWGKRLTRTIGSAATPVVGDDLQPPVRPETTLLYTEIQQQQQQQQQQTPKETLNLLYGMEQHDPQKPTYIININKRSTFSPQDISDAESSTTKRSSQWSPKNRR